LKRILHITSIAVLTIIFLGLFLWKSNLHQVWNILKSTNPYWLLVGLLVNFSAIVFRSVRWRVIIDRRDPPPFYWAFFANAVGYMFSAVLPVRAGDVVRPALLARRTKVRFASALGTVLTERVIDFIAIISIFVWFCLYHWRGYSTDPRTAEPFLIIKSGAFVAGSMLVGMVLLMFGIYFFRAGVRRAHEWLGRFLPQRFREPWMHFYDVFVQSLELARDPIGFVIVILCTAAIWAALTVQFYIGALAVQRPMPLDSGCLLGGVTTVGVAIPTPGGVGGFHKIAQWVLTSFYGFDIDSSVATAIIFHIIGTLPVIVVGLFLFVREGLHWRDITAGPS
jgi:uncharacterized protein (TIRG00374 family)